MVGFNGHPPLGVNATPTQKWQTILNDLGLKFQWAPTLGGECYTWIELQENPLGAIGFNGHPPLGVNATPEPKVVVPGMRVPVMFQWAPTLGGECYFWFWGLLVLGRLPNPFQWAPTLGGECYFKSLALRIGCLLETLFQWAPTLGGECYSCSLGSVMLSRKNWVSMGTHPWG